MSAVLTFILTGIEIIALIAIKFLYWSVEVAASVVMMVYLILQVASQFLNSVWEDLGGEEEDGEDNEDDE